ncbi:hypothetical protein [Nocardiopsis metallicus]|uniref:Uncharacterized protein n=1 Tax=Nocardiopsis metallicus TaxID=179819 RepID=A0A840WD66_9ACTN|nr:hypothetical protein [Nocardiopsis metallicus]MBB5490961.1 hypothetical protein [Nocardiopsis metallicus]
MSTKDKLLEALRGTYDAQRDADAQVQKSHAEGKAKVEAAIRERSRELAEVNHGMTVHQAREIATREIQAARAAEHAKADRERVDEAVRDIEARDRDSIAADSLRDKLRALATRPADFDQRVAEEKQRRAVEAAANEG